MSDVIAVQVGNRLREERVRLGLSQTEFAERVGASKRSQVVWEGGEGQLPNGRAFALWAQLGVDVAYVLTGSRSIPVAETLKATEQVLLENYRNTDKEGKRAIERAAMLESQRPMSVQQIIKGSGNIVAGRNLVGVSPPRKRKI